MRSNFLLLSMFLLIICIFNVVNCFQESKNALLASDFKFAGQIVTPATSSCTRDGFRKAPRELSMQLTQLLRDYDFKHRFRNPKNAITGKVKLPNPEMTALETGAHRKLVLNHCDCILDCNFAETKENDYQLNIDGSSELVGCTLVSATMKGLEKGVKKFIDSLAVDPETSRLMVDLESVQVHRTGGDEWLVRRQLQASSVPTVEPTASLTAAIPTSEPTVEPTTGSSMVLPTVEPTAMPTTLIPVTQMPSTQSMISTTQPTSATPTAEPTVEATNSPSITQPTTVQPTAEPTAEVTDSPSTSQPTTAEPTTAAPSTSQPTTAEPTTAAPSTSQPTTATPTVAVTVAPSTALPTEDPTAEPTLQMFDVVSFDTNVRMNGASSNALDEASERSFVRTFAQTLGVPESNFEVVGTNLVQDNEERRRLSVRVGRVLQDETFSLDVIIRATLNLVDFQGDYSDGDAMFEEFKAVLTDAVTSGSFGALLTEIAAELGGTVAQSATISQTIQFSDLVTIAPPTFEPTKDPNAGGDSKSSSGGGDGGLEDWQLALIVVGGVLFLAAVGVGLVFLFSSRSELKKADIRVTPSSDQNAPAADAAAAQCET